MRRTCFSFTPSSCGGGTLAVHADSGSYEGMPRAREFHVDVVAARTPEAVPSPPVGAS
jgi:hypothetical protein